MLRHRKPILLLLVAVLLAAGYAQFSPGHLQEFDFRVRGRCEEKSVDQWILTKSSSSTPVLSLYFHVRMGREHGHGNTFPVVVRELVDGRFDLIRHEGTTNAEKFDFEDGSSVRLFWSCEPIDRSSTKVHAVAVESRQGQPVSTRSRTITITRSPEAT
jgi:hypothetical protein